MPAVAVLAPVLPLPVAQPKPLHRMRSGRECPVCAEPRCMDADACAAEFAARTWMDCEECAGSGYDTLGFQIWCTVCGGAKVVEAGEPKAEPGYVVAGPQALYRETADVWGVEA